MIHAVPSRPWPYEGMPIISIRLPASELAARGGLTLSYWDEPGLGSCCGFGFRTDEHLYCSRQMLQPPATNASPATEIFADVFDIAHCGAASLVADLVGAFKLTPEILMTCGNVTALESSAAALVGRIESVREKDFWRRAVREGLPWFRWFRRSLSIADLDRKFQDSLLEQEWNELKLKMRPGDQLWPFEFHVRRYLGMRQGYLLLRKGQAIAGIVTIVS